MTLKENQIEDYISPSTQSALDLKANKDGDALTNTSVNGVSLDDTGPGTNYLSDDGSYKPLTSAPVDSVNGKTGVVVLDTSDISESTDANYVTDTEKTNVGNLDSTGGGTLFLADDGTYKTAGGGGGGSVTTFDKLEISGKQSTGVVSDYNTSQDGTLAKFSAYLRTAPTGASFTVDLKIESVVVATATITAGSTSGTTVSFTDDVLTEGDRIVYEITQVGSSVAGSSLTLALNLS